MDTLDLDQRLEYLIDKHGLSKTIATLVTICQEKAEHLESNWQEPTLAKQWTRAATVLDKTTRNTAIEIVSPL